MTVCSIEGCEATVCAREWCEPHYRRWKRYGDPMVVRRRPLGGACTVCGDPPVARDLCNKHWKAWRHHGDPTVSKAPLPFPECIWAKVDKNGPVPAYAPHLGPCWLWTGLFTANGYSKAYAGAQGQWTSGHRLVYTLVRGPIPDGLQLDHLCRVRACVNPGHLEPVTQSENMRRSHSARRIEAQVGA